MTESMFPDARVTAPAQQVPAPTRVLVVEDTASLRMLVTTFLQGHGFETAEAWSIAGAREQIDSFDPDIALLDLMLDDGEGYDLISRMSERGIPVMVISSKDAPLDRILCLEMGADDFLTKPFEMREMLLRTRRLVKLIPAEDERKKAVNTLDFGTFRLDLVERVATKMSGLSSKLTDAEFRLLRLFLENQGQVLERKHIGQEIFKRTFMDNSRSIDVLVSKLRKKIDTESGTSVITNVRSTGYVFNADMSVQRD